LFQRVSWWKYRAFRRANFLLSISKSTTEIAKCNNPGLPNGRVVHLCVEPPLFAPDYLEDPLANEVYDPTKRDSAVLIVANLHQKFLYKGHRHLIAAWPKVVKVCSDAELWIVGDGDGRPELEEQRKNLPRQVAKQILFLGQLDDTSLDQCYKRCRVFAMPSSAEGFGLVFVEAARYGIPCIGGKYDSVKEIVLHNETGLLVEQHPYDIALACLNLLTDDNLAKRLGEAGRQRYLMNFRFPHFRERLLCALGLELN
jgi:glycosyltransferase involved in cell wall biosynthesis